MTEQHLQQGKDTETACCAFFKSQGLKLIEKKFSRHGEIGLIILNTSTLIFIEVRFLKNNNFGDRLESITYTNQEKLRKTSELYLKKINNIKMLVLTLFPCQKTLKLVTINKNILLSR